MNKQEMAVWLAENVLKWKRHKTIKNMWVDSLNMNVLPMGYTFIDYIYSPIIFFIVWDTINIKQSVNVLKFTSLVDKYVCELILSTKPITKTGKDRYEVFYGTVYEAMKND